MKFQFSYQSLLKHRKLQEEIAHRDYVEAQTILDSQKALYKKLYTRLHEADAESNDLRGNSDGTKAPVPLLIELEEFMAGQKIKVARQREVVINHTQIVEGKQEILITAAKETKILEKLKQKKLAEFKKLLQKKERKRNDEIVVTRFKSGGRI